MPQNTITALKSFFQSGDQPNEDHFIDLIDSCYNAESFESYFNELENGDFIGGDIEKRTGTGSFVDLDSDQQELLDRGYRRGFLWGGSSNFAVTRYPTSIQNKYFFGCFFIHSSDASNFASEFFSFARNEAGSISNTGSRTSGAIQISPTLALVYGRGQVTTDVQQLLIGIGTTPANPSELTATGFYVQTSDTELNDSEELNKFFSFENSRGQISRVRNKDSDSVQSLLIDAAEARQNFTAGENNFGSTQSLGFNFGGRSNSILLPKIPALGRNQQNATISLWFRLLGTPATSFQNLFHHSDDAGSGNALLRHQIRFISGSSGGVVQYYAAGGFGSGITPTLTDQLGVVTNRGNFNDGVWHHCAAILDAGAERLIIDGCEDNSPLTSVPGGTPFDGGEIGFNRGTNQGSWHSESDIRVYSRVLTTEEIQQLLIEGPASKSTSVVAYDVRYVADASTTTIKDLSGNNLNASWLNHDPQVVERVDFPPTPNRLRNWYCLGNSLTIDTDTVNMAPMVDLCINNNEGMRYHVAHPADSKNNRTRFWQEALVNNQYDVLCMQAFQENVGDEGWELQNINEEESNFQHFIDMQDQLRMIVIHQAFPTSGIISNAAYDYEQALGNGDFAYSRAYFDELHSRLSAANPGIEIRQTRTAEAMALLKIRIAEGGSPFSSIGSMYRDGIHMHLGFGRWFIHNCARRSVGFDWSDYGIWNTAASSTPQQIRYLQNVIREIHG